MKTEKVLHVTKIKELADQISEHPYPLLFATISGAHIYGFPSANSDFDLRGVHLLPLKELLGLSPPNETVEKSSIRNGLDIDLVTHDAGKFFRLLLKRNGYVLEQLLSPLVVHSTPEFIELKEIAAGCITRYHAHHYLGFAQTQWNLYTKATPRRVKPLLYVYRVLWTGIHLMRTGEILTNLDELNEIYPHNYVSELIDIKCNGDEKETIDDNTMTFHQSEYSRLVARLQEEFQASKLSETPSSQSALNDLLIRIRTNAC